MKISNVSYPSMQSELSTKKSLYRLMTSKLNINTEIKYTNNGVNKRN